MARIAGVNLPKEKRIEVGLTAIYGIGRNLSAKILKEANINIDKKVEELSEPEVAILRDIIARYATEGDLKRKITIISQKVFIYDLKSFSLIIVNFC